MCSSQFIDGKELNMNTMDKIDGKVGNKKQIEINLKENPYDLIHQISFRAIDCITQ